MPISDSAATELAQLLGSSNRLLATPAGDTQLRIPRFRTGSFFPSLLVPRRRVFGLW